VTAASSSDLEVFRNEARAWLAEQEPPVISGYWLDHIPALRAWQRDLWRGGLVGAAYAEEHGGGGLTVMHQVIADQEIVRSRAPSPIGGPGLIVVGPLLAQFGSDEQKVLLPRLLAGDDLWSLGFSEPEAGSDLAAAETRAVADGDGFLVDGVKVWTGFAAYSSYMLLIARTDPQAAKHRGLSLFVVPMDSEGIAKHPLREMTGSAEAEKTQFYRVEMSNVRIGPEALIGEINDGWKYILWSVARERGPYVLLRQAELDGHFTRLLDAISELDLTERQIAETGRVQTLLETLRGQSERTISRMIDHPGVATPEDSADKLFIAEAEQALYHLALTLLGPYRGVQQVTPSGLDAYMYTVGYMYSRAASIYGGTDQIQRNIIAQRKLELPRV
jgi:alkylation response protein AidB-like acyl-CoA dehydrogenase